ncbi:glucosylceramidase [Parapedobacter pyrenivorans]|uniref:Glucosylceramidase n=1 Tax=Parapedobacter pyrenivorans TaxID=1305674 RepID=A0A917HEN0_9SPHI|nr:glycoside hydrolase family 30 beta sandwich domain-containing protein [Parapedobacter pyrenivorans]GGG76863.1 glucosylceramidase [Parapedobacter pyrenivorans]
MISKILKKLSIGLFVATILLPLACNSPQSSVVEWWLTNTHDGSALFEKQTAISLGKYTEGDLPVIEIDSSHHYQTIDGFGFSLTGGSAQHLIRMSTDVRTALLRELFATDANNIGISYLRVSIGASDLNAYPFSYNDLPDGETDPGMEKFDLGPDREDVIPILKEILSINPNLLIMGSPWSPPKWMKTNHDTRGGSLKPEYYPAYAKYFVKYIQQMQAEGIRIDAITVQNEPLHPGNNPSLLMLAEEMGEFVKNHLGPAFEQASIATKIIVYDHNCDRPDYPISILDDPETRKYVSGSAFHLYGGTIDALSTVHEKHPDKELHFTEQWMGAPGDLSKDMPNHIKQLTIGATRNWSRTVLEWNLANGPDHKPHTDRGGCDRCLGGITIDGDRITRNPAYYVVAHSAKFVRPGSVRIASNELAGLPNVAFHTPAGKTVLIVLNESDSTQIFRVRNNEQQFTSTLQRGAVATFIL